MGWAWDGHGDVHATGYKARRAQNVQLHAKKTKNLTLPNDVCTHFYTIYCNTLYYLEQ